MPQQPQANTKKRPEVKINKNQEGEIEIHLPLNTPTGKVRIKRPKPGYAPTPVAGRSETIQENDYIEWQISYDSKPRDSPTEIKTIAFKRNGEERYACELIHVLKLGEEINLIPKAKIDEIKALIESPLENSISEFEKIEMPMENTNRANILTDFTKHAIKTPNYIKKTAWHTIEIRIEARQRGTGNQAMIYVNIPIAKCTGTSSTPSIIGREAKAKEYAKYTINRENSEFIIDTIRAFAFASQQHREDLKMIFEKYSNNIHIPQS